MSDRYNLERFVIAQAGVYEQALRELTSGRKKTHWMWYIFPQIAGLGASMMAQRYAIGSLEEAREYLQHPVLGDRLRACTAVVNLVDNSSAHDIFGSPDDMKFRSSLTLFSRADPAAPEFKEGLALFFGGVEDASTLMLLSH